MLEITYIIVMMLFLFGITIFVHEWGHFIVARKCGLVVEAFSIGMGPALWKKEIDGIVYKIGAFPIGGYVSLPQLDPEGMEKVQGDNGETNRKSLPDVSPWKKIAVAVSGPLCNIIFALLLGTIVSLAPEDALIDEDGVFVADVEQTSAAYTAGLRPGDEIKAINGNRIKTWYEAKVESLLASGNEKQVEFSVGNAEGERTIMLSVNNPEKEENLINGVYEAHACQVMQVVAESPAEVAGLQSDDLVTHINGTVLQGSSHFIEIVQANGDTEIMLTLVRKGETMNVPVTPKHNKEHDVVMIGIQFSGALSMPWALTGNPIEQIQSDASSIFRLLKALTTKGEAKQAASGLGGPVAIFTMIWFALKMGIINALGLIRFININLAVLNLLPLPVLDGGHICFALWEGITKRKVHPKVVISLVNAFAILLIGAMLFLSWRDVDRNWGVSKLFKKDKPAVEALVEPVGESKNKE
ncbi:MAG: RIP metalloprotease RseP [Kiritimatiellaceae bacterium]|nr:RIP metalloprotease RseP [Kiritimatiellaceae bacterium]